jgi:glyoxylase-like metal-dependent hydrolase (beta-lactamase superfamily II)
MATGATSLCCFHHQALAQGPAGSIAAKGYLVRELRDRVYWLTDGAYSTMFAVTDSGVVVFDAPPTIGIKYFEAIREVTEKPITHLVYSHEHVDHIAGAHLFPKDIQIIGHRETAAILKRRNDSARPPPNVTFDDTYTIETGGQTIELSHKGPNHSIDNIFIRVPRARVLMFIDVIYPGWMPYKNLGVAADVPGFVASHKQALAFDFDTLVGGHVDRVGTRDDVLRQIELVDDLMTAAEQAYATLSFPEYLKSKLASPDGKSAWELHNDYEMELVASMAETLRQLLAG